MNFKRSFGLGINQRVQLGALLKPFPPSVKTFITTKGGDVLIVSRTGKNITTK